MNSENPTAVAWRLVRTPVFATLRGNSHSHRYRHENVMNTFDPGEQSRSHGLRRPDGRLVAVITEVSRSLIFIDIKTGITESVIGTK